jgi:hypothetical protein
MTYYEEIPETTVRRKFVKRTCDLCGAEAKDFCSWTSHDHAMGEHDETKLRVEVQRQKSTGYPETSWGTTWEADICPTCFATKLVPWLRSQGATVRECEW